MRELPRGTVTFLFTDVEASTRLLHELGAERYAAVLDDHRRVVREACMRHDGVEVDTQGDAFFIAFPTAPGALAAAREAQDALAVPVRMGVHTGTPLLAQEGYVGADVHRAARIAAAGHGGQVLVSASTRALLDRDAGLLLDLGKHRLKDLSAEERLWQLGDREFPRLNTLYQTNLPVPPTPFLGRERELREVSALLLNGVRLLTLSGSGGTGKTRLALHAVAAAGDAYPDGIWWVPLGALADPTLVLPTAANSIAARDDLAADIGVRRLLLLFDNFEHVIEAAADVAALLGVCPSLTVLVTSRERLQVEGEHEYTVPTMASADGVELFAARARARGAEIDEDDYVVRELCERLDNLPLALELAAARTKLFSPAQLLERLGRRLDLFKGGRDADPRQLTLRATISWSYDLLTAEEQSLFARCAVFTGGCTYDAAEAICDAREDTLQSLLDKSLLRRRESASGDLRYWMLETIREFALERLSEHVDRDALRRRHADFFLELAESRPHVRHDLTWLERVQGDHANLRSATAWALEHREARFALRLAASLTDFWDTFGYLAEGLAVVREALANDTDAPIELLDEALNTGVLLAIKQGDTASAREWADRHVALARESQDENILGNALNGLGITLMEEGRYTEARPALEEAIAINERLANKDRIQSCLHNLGLISLSEQAYERALAELTRALEVSEALGTEHRVCNDRVDRAFAQIGLGRWTEARLDSQQSIRLADRLGWAENAAYGLVALAAVSIAENELADAARFLGQADRLAEELGLQFTRYADQVRADAHQSLVSRLTRGQLRSALAEGRVWSLDEAVAEAVGGSLD